MPPCKLSSTVVNFSISLTTVVRSIARYQTMTKSTVNVVDPGTTGQQGPNSQTVLGQF